MRLVKKKRKLTKLTKRFLGYTFITLILILGCLLSYPKLEIKDNEITILSKGQNTRSMDKFH